MLGVEKSNAAIRRTGQRRPRDSTQQRPLPSSRTRKKSEGRGKFRRGLRLHPFVEAISVFGAYDDLAVLHVGDKARGILPHRSERKLHLLVNVTLEETRAVGRAIALLGQEVERGGRYTTALALRLHLATELRRVELRDLSDLVHRQRREDDYLVNAVTELRREAVLRRLHHVALDGLHVAQSLRAEAERLLLL